MAPKNNQPDDGTYVSSSTIDSPPRPEKDEEDGESKQMKLIDDVPNEELTKKELDGDQAYRTFGVELTLKLKRGRVYTIPLLAGEFNSMDVIGLLDLALKGRRNRVVIESILDNPPKKEEPQQTTIEDAVKANAAEENHSPDTTKKVGKKSKKKKAGGETDTEANGSYPAGDGADTHAAADGMF